MGKATAPPKSNAAKELSSCYEKVDRVPSGWFLLEIMRIDPQGWSWVALMSSRDPHRPVAAHIARRYVYVRIPGKHRSRDAARDALRDMVTTRRRALLR